MKYPRLEAWGESQEQEQGRDTTTTVQENGNREGQVGSRQDTTPVPPSPVQQEGEHQLGGEQKVKKAQKTKLKRMMNKEKGKAGMKAPNKTRAEKVMMEPPISVLFADNTKGGTLARKLKEEEKRLGGVTSYRIRIVESAGMALSRLLPSTNPWGPGDCGREDCKICSQDDEASRIA